MRVVKSFQIFVATSVLLGLIHVVVRQLTEPTDRLHQFVYERGPVQYATPFVACLVAVSLLDRFSQYRWNRGRFGALVQGQGQPPQELAEQLDLVGKILGEHGAAAAAAGAERAAQRYENQVQKAHDAINYIAGLLPALGLFGTMLGLSESLFVSFSGGFQGPEAVRMFVAGLGTAIDTTVLGMVCAVPLFGCAWFLGQWEHELAEQYAAYVWSQFRLDAAAAGGKPLHGLGKELRRLTAQIAEEAKAAFQRVLADSANTYHANLNRAVGAVFSRQRRRDKDMVKGVAAELAAGLGQSMREVGDLVERHNNRLAENMSHHVGQLEKALQNRIPEEVVIRYQHNGQAHKGVDPWVSQNKAP